MVVNFVHPPIVVPHLLLEEHFHPFPARGITGFAEAQTDCIEELSYPCRLQCETCADHCPSGRLRPKHRARAERPNDFVVAHVDDPEVTLLIATIVSDLANHM